MTEELIRLWHLEKEFAEQEKILPLLAAGDFNEARQKLDNISDAIETLRVAGFGPFTGFGGPLN
jgi:hypothetical protein